MAIPAAFVEIEATFERDLVLIAYGGCWPTQVSEKVVATADRGSSQLEPTTDCALRWNCRGRQMHLSRCHLDNQASV